MAAANTVIKQKLLQIKSYFDENADFDEIKDYFDKEVQKLKALKRDDVDALEDENDGMSDHASLVEDIAYLEKTEIGKYKVAKQAFSIELRETLKELNAHIRLMRGENAHIDTNPISWPEISKLMPNAKYIAFIYTLGRLKDLKPKSIRYLNTSILAVSTYVLLTALPGVRRFNILILDVLKSCLAVFTSTRRLLVDSANHRSNNIEPNSVWLNFLQLADDCKICVRYVHFREENLKSVLLEAFINYQYGCHQYGFHNHIAVEIHARSFQILFELTSPHHGEPAQTLLRILHLTSLAHTLDPMPNHTIPLTTHEDYAGFHISDWYIRNITKYPKLFIDILTYYIRAILTNVPKHWEKDDICNALKYGAKYSAALFKVCNYSDIDIIRECMLAVEVAIRIRTLDLVSCVLEINAEVEWDVFTHDVSKIPREVNYVEVIFKALKDRTDSVVLKALSIINNLFEKGSPTTILILNQCIRFSKFKDGEVKIPESPKSYGHVKFEVPIELPPSYSFKGFETLRVCIEELPRIIYDRVLNNKSALVRRAGIQLIERVALINPNLLYTTRYIVTVCKLIKDQASTVRKQTLVSVDIIFEKYQLYFQALWAWCKVIKPMFSDSDEKNIDVALECFRKRVLANLASHDMTISRENYLAWVLLRTLLMYGDRLYIQNCFNASLKASAITADTLMIIESHLDTAHSVEAWMALSFIGDKVKSQQPDRIADLFTRIDSWSQEYLMLLGLEVLRSCLDHYSHPALNNVFKFLNEKIRTGKVISTLITPSVDLLTMINAKSGENPEYCKEKWLHDLNNHLENTILEGIPNFPNDNERMITFLYSYTEINIQTVLRPNETIIEFVEKYILECIKYSKDELTFAANIKTFDGLLTVMARFSIRDPIIAERTINIFGTILTSTEVNAIINKVLDLISDLAQNYTHLIELLMDNMILKLFSPITPNRKKALKIFDELITRDQLKLRDSLWLVLLKVILDEESFIAKSAMDFFTFYAKDKNPMIFRKCLTESPYYFNAYKNFAGYESLNTATKSELPNGQNNKKQRKLIYNYLINKIDDFDLIAHFSQLKAINEKCRSDPEMKTPAGIDVIKDILFILKRICQSIKKFPEIDTDKLQQSTDDIETLDEDKPTTSRAATVSNAQSRKRQTTVKEAIIIFEDVLANIPRICTNLRKHNTTLNKYLNNLCYYIAQEFPSHVQYAQPSNFWNKYIKIDPTTEGESEKRSEQPKFKGKKAKNKRGNVKEKRRSADDVANVSISVFIKPDSDLEDENELPLDKHLKSGNMQTVINNSLFEYARSWTNIH